MTVAKSEGKAHGVAAEAENTNDSSEKGPLQRALGFFDSTTKILVAVGGLVAAVTGLWAGLSHLVPSADRAGSNSHSAVAAHFVIQPESCGSLTFGADGNAGPVTCPDGRPNLAEDRWLRPLHLKVLGLGPAANPNEVENAICHDFAAGRTTGPIESSAVRPMPLSLF